MCVRRTVGCCSRLTPSVCIRIAARVYMPAAAAQHANRLQLLLLLLLLFHYGSPPPLPPSLLLSTYSCTTPPPPGVSPFF